ncbi:MAG: hypothetical protein IJO45_01950 [Oscillospiraceae bacterium]|nr:hypothetical protein [Oscillospiraceae bacterium]
MAQYPSVQYVRFYTDGSAARKLEPVAPLKRNTLRLPAQKKSKGKAIYVDPVAILSMAVAVCLLIVMAIGVGKYYAVRAEADDMASYVHYLQQENQRLTQEYAQSYDLNEIKQTAKALGMVPAEQIGSTPIDVSIP